MEQRVPFNELSTKEKARITYIDIQRRKAQRTKEKNKKLKVNQEEENIRDRYEIDNYVYDRTMKYLRKHNR